MKRITIAALIAATLFSSAVLASTNHPHASHHSTTAIEQTQAVKTNLNTATIEQLDSLKGLGPKKAKAIIDDREKNGHFKSIADLSRVKGIGSKMVSRLITNNPGSITVE